MTKRRVIEQHLSGRDNPVLYAIRCHKRINRYIGPDVKKVAGGAVCAITTAKSRL